jgi:hypothetical protein
MSFKCFISVNENIVIIEGFGETLKSWSPFTIKGNTKNAKCLYHEMIFFSIPSFLCNTSLFHWILGWQSAFVVLIASVL